jgi:hypothetical protein
VLSDLGVCGGADGGEEARSPCGAASKLKAKTRDVKCGEAHRRERERERK